MIIILCGKDHFYNCFLQTNQTAIELSYHQQTNGGEKLGGGSKSVKTHKNNRSRGLKVMGPLGRSKHAKIIISQFKTFGSQSSYNNPTTQGGITKKYRLLCKVI